MPDRSLIFDAKGFQGTLRATARSTLPGENVLNTLAAPVLSYIYDW
jgi:hypothetical protein